MNGALPARPNSSCQRNSILLVALTSVSGLEVVAPFGVIDLPLICEAAGPGSRWPRSGLDCP